MKTRPTFFYGWIIVALCMLSTMFVYGIRHSFSVFFPFILDEFGWSRAATSVMLSLNILVYGLAAPLAGILADRIHPRRLMTVGLCILAAATACCGLARELWHFYVLFGLIMPLGTALSGWPLLSPTLSNWFVAKRGLIIGLGQTGVALSFVYGMVAEYTISLTGWRFAYPVLAVIVLAVLLPLLLLFFYYHPEEKGLQPLGATPPQSSGSSHQPGSGSSPSPGNLPTTELMKEYRLWLFVLSMLLYWGIGIYLVLAHQVKYVAEAGYSTGFAASVFALFGVFMAAGQLTGGISDLIGREITVTVGGALNVIAIVALLAVEDASRPWLLYLYAGAFGYGTGIFNPTLFAAAADIYHGRRFATVSGLILTGLGIGGAVGPWLGGYIFDTTGSYTSAFMLCIVCVVLACVCVWIAAPRNFRPTTQ